MFVDNHLAYYRLIRVTEERSYTVESLIKCYNSKSYRCVSPQCTETYTTIEEALRHMRVSSHSVIDNNDWSYKRRDKIPHSQTQPVSKHRDAIHSCIYCTRYVIHLHMYKVYVHSIYLYLSVHSSIVQTCTVIL